MSTLKSRLEQHAAAMAALPKAKQATLTKMALTPADKSTLRMLMLVGVDGVGVRVEDNFAKKYREWAVAHLDDLIARKVLAKRVIKGKQPKWTKPTKAGDVEYVAGPLMTKMYDNGVIQYGMMPLWLKLVD